MTRFNADMFGWMNDDSMYLPGWSNITAAELNAHTDSLEEQGLSREDAPDIFMSIDAMNEFLMATGLIDSQGSVMGIKIDEGGLIEQINGPAIFAAVDGNGDRTDEIVMRVGDSSILLEVDGANAKIGELRGELTVAEVGEGRDSFRTVTFEYLSATLEDSVEISCVLNVKEVPAVAKLTKGNLKKAIKDGYGNLAKLLRTVPTGESFVKPRDLDVGEYQVVSVEENEPHKEYGRSWKIILQGVGPMMSTGKRLNGTLTRRAKLYIKWLNMGNPLTFKIVNKEEVSQGIRVDCGFFKREPDPNKLIGKPKQITQVTTGPISALPEATQTTLDVPAIEATISGYDEDF